MKLKFIIVMLLLSLLSLSLVACGGGNNATNTPATSGNGNGNGNGASNAAAGSRSFSVPLLDIDSTIKRVLAPRGADPLYNRVVEIALEDGIVRIEGVRRISGEDLSMVLVQTLTVEDGALVSSLEAGGDAGVESDDTRVTSLNDIMVRAYTRLLPEADREIIFVSVTVNDDAIVFSYDLG